MESKTFTHSSDSTQTPHLGPMLSEHTAVVLLVDPASGNIYDANRSAQDFYGYSKEQFVGINIFELNAMGKGEIEALLRSIGQKDLKRFETVHRKANGELVDVEVISSPVTTSDDEVAFLSIVNDISDRKKAQRDLEESEEKFRLISEQTMLNVGILQDGCFVYANNSLAELVEYTAEDLYSWGPAEFLKTVHPEDRAFAGEQSRRKQAGEDGIVTHYHLRFVTRTGQTKFTEIYSRTVNYNGRPADLLTIVDFSERQRLEQERSKLEQRLVHAQKMEAIGSLAAGVAHDFNNILQTIGGHMELLTMANDISDKQLQRIRQLDSSIARGAGLVRRLLTFSRKMEPSFQKLDINNLLRQSVDLLSRTIPKMIDISIKTTSEKAIVAGDAGLLEQVVLNLGANARDAMPQGGKLFVATSSVIVCDDAGGTEGLPPGRYVHVRFSDTGHGMDQQTLEKVFDPFFTTKDPGHGTGLGLATAQGVIRSHGGDIRCSSQPGFGTTFDIYIPEVTGRRTSIGQKTIEVQTLTGSGELILLVDDEQPILDTSAELFESSGYEVLKAITGEQALELYEKHGDKIKLVVLDLGMPGMGGMACLERLKAVAPRIKIIVASGYASSSGVDDVLRAGAEFFLPKPFRLPDLLAKTRQLLDKSAA